LIRSLPSDTQRVEIKSAPPPGFFRGAIRARGVLMGLATRRLRSVARGWTTTPPTGRSVLRGGGSQPPTWLTPPTAGTERHREGVEQP